MSPLEPTKQTALVEHQPVLVEEILTSMSSLEIEPQNFLDLTFGRGGHTRALLERFPHLNVEAWDRDVQAIHYGQEQMAQLIACGQLKLVQKNFHLIRSDQNKYDLILMDLGVSSPQLDQAHRGFSFYHSGPLDMRMDQSQGITAADIVNTWSEGQLNQLFQTWGEVRKPNRVTKRIIEQRKQKLFVNTEDLSLIVEQAEGWARRGHHPATRYFLALRIAVNNELEGLEQCLEEVMRSLNPGGRLLIITFHSLEDRVVKYAFKAASDLGYPVNKKVITAPYAAVKKNPRARSAKLRIFQRGLQHDSRHSQNHSQKRSPTPSERA